MAITAGTNLNNTPASQKQTLTSNYIDFTDGSTGWEQQYLPDLMEKEAEVFGNRTVSGFLSQVGAEESMTSDQVVWSEQGRLHLAYNGQIRHLTQESGGGAGGQLGIIQDIDGNAVTTTHGIRTNDILLVADSATTQRLLVTGFGATDNIINVQAYGAVTMTAAGFTVAASSDGSTVGVTILVVGSEWGKGVDGQAGNAAGPTASQPQHTSFNNKPIIIKDHYHINGSDTSAIGWVEVSGEDGAGGYLWYLKAEGETRMRFTDYLEMAMIESELGVAGSTLADNFISGGGNSFGTQGLFSAISTRGNMASGIDPLLAPATNLGEFDSILSNTEGKTQNIGQPELPTYTFNYSIKNDKNYEVELIINEYTIYENIHLFPTQPIYKIGDEKKFIKDKDIYFGI